MMKIRLICTRLVNFQQLFESRRSTIYFNRIVLLCTAIFLVYLGIATKTLGKLRVHGLVPITIKPYPREGTGKLFNINKDFKFSIFNSFCDKNKDIVAIIPVYSAAENFKRRQAIRDTVGKDCVKFKCAVFFIVGVTLNNTVYYGVRDEYSTRKDILMIRHIDTYRDLNNKAIAMLNWLVRFCPQPKYVIHIIDDSYPNIRYFLEHLDSIKRTKFILGLPAIGARPFRNIADNKWSSNKSLYPYMYYPTYVFGTTYAFLNSDSKTLMDAAYTSNYFWIEDVWLTGIVRKAVGFDIVTVSRKMLELSSTVDGIARTESGYGTWSVLKTIPKESSIVDSDVWEKYYCVHKLAVSWFYDIFNVTRHAL